MIKYVYIIVGGATGSILRFLVSHFISTKSNSSFPAGTFTVNIIGSLMIGFLFGLYSLNGVLDDKVKFLVFIGFLGGFTTFSAFALENIKLINSGLISVSVVYILLSNILGIALAFAGYFAGLRLK